MNFIQKLKIVEIGDRFDQEYIQRINYFSNDYLLDADIIFIDFAQIVKEIEAMVLPLEDNEPSINELDYWRILTKIEQRKKQLLEYFNNGGNLFVRMLSVMILQFDLQKLDNTIKMEEIDLFSLITLDSNYTS